VRTVASRNEGIGELLAAIESHRAHLAEGGRIERRRRDQLRLRVETILNERVLAAVRERGGLASELERAFDARIDPYQVAERLFHSVAGSESADDAQLAERRT